MRLDRGEVVGDARPELEAVARDVRRSGIVEVAGTHVFADVYGPPPRLVAVGAVDTGEAVCAAARALGWHTICVDARARFATPERMPSADRIVVAWPEEAFAEIGLDRDTAVVVLTHDDKFDVPALAAALRSDAFYVAALGSRVAQESRRARLLEVGLGGAGTRASVRAGGPRHRRGKPGRDGRVDPGRGARRACRTRRRPAAHVDGAHPRRALDAPDAADTLIRSAAVPGQR